MCRVWVCVIGPTPIPTQRGDRGVSLTTWGVQHVMGLATLRDLVPNRGQSARTVIIHRHAAEKRAKATLLLPSC